MMHLTKKDLLTNEELKKSLYENFIAKTLAEMSCPLYYYQSEGKAELSFVIQNRMGKIIPIELATISNSKAKSLSVFMKKFLCLEAYRITENNFQTKKEIRYIPVYAIFCLDEIMN
jgi:predicted AAA+ superfamily ATPase